jgi:hypothetical protein
MSSARTRHIALKRRWGVCTELALAIQTAHAMVDRAHPPANATKASRLSSSGRAFKIMKGPG